jgi:predicted phage terminase large subunit-like protein
MHQVKALQRQRAEQAARRAAQAAARQAFTNPNEDLTEYITRTARAHTPIPWHLARLVELFERAIRTKIFALVSMPPRHAKTTTLQRAMAHAIKKFPDRLNAIGMHSAPAARVQSKRIRRLVEAENIECDGNIDLWRTGAKGDGGLFVTGLNGQWTGKGIGGVAVLDDILKGRKQAESPALRESIWNTVTDDIITRLEPPCGSLVVVATRWHDDDPPGRLIRAAANTKDFPPVEVINLPALRDPLTGDPSDLDDAVPLWPELFDLGELKARRAILGPYGWNGLFQGRPVPRGGSVFKREPGRWYTAEENAGRRIVLTLDAAGTEGTHSDYTVALALAFDGVDATTTCNVLGMLRVRLEPQDSARLLRQFIRDHGDGKIYIEASRDGKAIAKMLRAIDSSFRIVEVPPVGDKFTRSQPVAAGWNDTPSRVRLPADAVAHPWVKDILDEAALFTGMGDKHDDIVDALAQGWNVSAKKRAFVGNLDNSLQDD